VVLNKPVKHVGYCPLTNGKCLSCMDDRHDTPKCPYQFVKEKGTCFFCCLPSGVEGTIFHPVFTDKRCSYECMPISFLLLWDLNRQRFPGAAKWGTKAAMFKDLWLDHDEEYRLPKGAHLFVEFFKSTGLLSFL